jgi:hypothetical protein
VLGFVGLRRVSKALIVGAIVGPAIVICREAASGTLILDPAYNRRAVRWRGCGWGCHVRLGRVASQYGWGQLVAQNPAKTCLDAKQVKKKRGPAKSAQRMMAERLGLTRQQMYQALAIAKIPKEDFKRMHNGLEPPPSLEELARIGRGQQGKRVRRKKCCPHCGGEL